MPAAQADLALFDRGGGLIVAEADPALGIIEIASMRLGIRHVESVGGRDDDRSCGRDGEVERKEAGRADAPAFGHAPSPGPAHEQEVPCADPGDAFEQVEDGEDREELPEHVEQHAVDATARSASLSPAPSFRTAA
jgi:hypothetical protein